MNEMLIANGVASREDIVQSLQMAEQTAISDYNVEYLSPANRDAVAFPLEAPTVGDARQRGWPDPAILGAGAVGGGNERALQRPAVKEPMQTVLVTQMRAALVALGRQPHWKDRA